MSTRHALGRAGQHFFLRESDDSTLVEVNLSPMTPEERVWAAERLTAMAIALLGTSLERQGGG